MVGWIQGKARGRTLAIHRLLKIRFSFGAAREETSINWNWTRSSSIGQRLLHCAGMRPSGHEGLILRRETKNFTDTQQGCICSSFMVPHNYHQDTHRKSNYIYRIACRQKTRHMLDDHTREHMHSLTWGGSTAITQLNRDTVMLSRSTHPTFSWMQTMGRVAYLNTT